MGSRRKGREYALQMLYQSEASGAWVIRAIISIPSLEEAFKNLPADLIIRPVEYRIALLWPRR